MKKQILTLMFGLAGIMSTMAQDSEAKNALSHAEKQFFIENKGQWPGDVLYLTRIDGLDAWITKNGVLYDFYKLEEVSGNTKTEEILHNKFEQKDYIRTGHKVCYKLQNNNSSVKAEGKEKQAGYYNYLLSNDPSKHASNVGLYKEALVKNVYDGIDMRYYFDKENIRYDYVVYPGADPSQIAFVLQGTDKTYLNPQGDIIFNTRFGTVALAELQTYQGTKDNKVSSRFVKTKNGWSIALGNYDSKQTLIIDPLIYSTYLGGSADDRGAAIAIDVSGNAYVTGSTFSTDYDITTGAYQTSHGGGTNDAFVTKLNAAGTALVYSTYLGGSNDDLGTSIALDASDNAYIVGITGSTNYVTTSGAHQKRHAGKWDIFVTKLNTTGTALVYSTYLGGSNDEYGFSIAINSSCNAYVTGATFSTNFDTTSGAWRTSLQGNCDAFVTKLNTTGTDLEYSTYLGGSNDDLGTSIALDDSDNVYVTGYTTSTNYDITLGAYQTSFAGGFDAFVTKLNAAGTALVYSTYLGGSGYDQGYSIAINASGNAYVTGTSSTDYDIISGAYQTSYGGGFSDIFVTKLNTKGTALVYSTYLGGSDADFVASIAVDVWGNAYLTGYTKSKDYDTTSGSYQTRCTDCGGRSDAFLTQLNATGTTLVYSTYLGGNMVNEGKSIAVDAAGNAYIAGYTESSNYHITSGSYRTRFICNDVFVTKICLVAKASVSLSLSAGTDAQSLCIHTPITDIIYTTANATYATVNGLPAGVKGNFSANKVTISGTPVASGTYNYTVIVSGGCSNAITKGSITVNPYPKIAIASASGTDSQSICINNAMANITYVTTDATGATFTGLPAGVTGSFAFNVATIRGTPGSNGKFSYTVTFTGACGASTAKGSMTVNPDNTIGLSSASGTDSQSVCKNTTITDIIYTTTRATGASVSGLPTGVTGSFVANTLTISGTPTASGTYHYIITLTGGCGTVTAKGSIVVNPDNTIGLSPVSGRDSQSVCINTAIADITYMTTGATGATVTGLPSGVTGSFASNVVSISGTPTLSDTYLYTITLSGGCGTVTTKGSIIVNPDNTISLSSSAGTDLQSLCIHTSITNIVYATTDDVTGATVSGLPDGVTNSFDANEVTISGTPTVSGTFDYTVTLIGGCGTATAKGSIIVNPENTISLSSTSGTDTQRVKVNNSITDIKYATTDATGATVTGLPAGVTGSFANNVVTISGAPTISGNFPYAVTLTGGCGIIKAAGSIDVATLGIAHQAKQTLQILPNPSDAEVSINGEFSASVQIEIIDALGKISQAIYSVHRDAIKLHVSSLENGMYCIRIIDNGQAFQSKMIVQH